MERTAKKPLTDKRPRGEDAAFFISIYESGKIFQAGILPDFGVGVIEGLVLISSNIKLLGNSYKYLDFYLLSVKIFISCSEVNFQKEVSECQKQKSPVATGLS